MPENEEELIFSCGVILRNHEVVIVRPPSQGARAKWAFPGTRVDKGETPEAACRRICQEALGAAVVIEVGQPPLRGQFGEQTVIYRYHFCTLPEGDVENRGFAEVRWVHIAQLADYEFDPTSDMVAKWLTQNFGPEGKKGPPP